MANESVAKKPNSWHKFTKRFDEFLYKIKFDKWKDNE